MRHLQQRWWGFDSVSSNRFLSFVNPRPANARTCPVGVQDFMYRRAVASCCRALWCCCFKPCYRHDEDGEDDGSNDVDDADRTRQTDDAEQGSSVSVLNSFTDVDLADEMEKGVSVAVVTTVPPAVSETPPRTPRKSMAALYATPHHGVRQDRPWLAPARPARPDRGASTGRHTSGRSGAAGSGSRRKRTAKSTVATDTAVEAAAGVRRQRALVGRVQTNGRRVRRRFLSQWLRLEGGWRAWRCPQYFRTPRNRQPALLVLRSPAPLATLFFFFENSSILTALGRIDCSSRHRTYLHFPANKRHQISNPAAVTALTRSNPQPSPPPMYHPLSQHKPVVESAPTDDDKNAGIFPVSSARNKTRKPDDSRKKRHNHRRVERANGGGRKRSSGRTAATRAGPALSPDMPIAISMPVLTAGAVSARRTTGAAGAAGKTPGRSRQKDGRNDTGIRYLGDDETFSSSDSSTEIQGRVGAPSRREARRSRPS